MSAWLILPMAVGAAFIFRMLADRYRIVRYCTKEHWVGTILLRHHAKVPCDVALWVASHAQKLWGELAVDFPTETQEGFVLNVVCNPDAGPGWRPLNEPRAVINLARFFLDITHPSFESQERYLRGTIAEELHHIVRYRRLGEEPYRFRAEHEDGHLGAVIYYAVNEFENEALQFCVRTTGDRAELLAEVEEYLRRSGSET